MIRLFYTFLFSLLLICSSCQQEKRAKYIIGVSQCSDDLWRQTMNEEMIREATFYDNTEIIIKTVKDDTNKQINDIESFISDNVDLLIISPNEASYFTQVIQKAHRKDIPVILVDRKIDTNDFTAYVGADNYQIGKEAGLYVAEKLKQKGNVVIIRGWNGSTSDAERYNGFNDVIRNYNKINIVAEGKGNFLKEDAKKAMDEILQKHEQIDLVFALNDPMASGVYESISHYSGKMPMIIGIDALLNVGVQNILNGSQTASFIYPTGGDKVIELAMNILTHKPYKKEIILPTTLVNRNNARVLQLQLEKIIEQQSKVKKMNNLLNKSISQFSNQRILFYISIVVLVLITFLLLLSTWAYKIKSKVNEKLRKKNIEIIRQSEELKEQKQQLLDLTIQLEEATNAKLGFFTNISHEFKTPLSLILGPVDELLTDTNINGKGRQYLKLVKKNSNRLLLLISEIIEFRTYENGKMKVNYTEGNLREFIEELNPLFSNLIKRSNVSFVFNSDDADYSMSIDKDKVEKIYFNLLSNAFKYVNKLGIVRIELRKKVKEEQEYAEITVFNSGSYIAPNELENIFNRFYKLDTSSTSTGIGLALTISIVEILNGTMQVNSEKGVGTTFKLSLPIVHNATTKNLVPYESGYTKNYLESESDYSNNNILKNNSINDNKPIVQIIEDNPDMRNFMRQILEEEYSIIESKDGEEGLTEAKKYMPDLIISDVMMPQKDGFEVCKLLKENISTSHIPIILLTACSLDEEKTIGFESGADAYIPKPFNAHLLKIRARKLIENRQKMKVAFSHNIINDTKKESLGEIEQNFINDFQHYVERHISNPELSVDELAEHLKLSRSQLYRKIKSLTDYSPNELIRIVRLKYAKLLLNSKVKSVSEVAYEAGFSSPSYFAKCFKDIYGGSPSEYMEQLK